MKVWIILAKDFTTLKSASWMDIFLSGYGAIEDWLISYLEIHELMLLNENLL